MSDSLLKDHNDHLQDIQLIKETTAKTIANGRKDIDLSKEDLAFIAEILGDDGMSSV